MLLKRRWVILGAIVGVLLIAGVTTWRVLRVSDLVEIGAGYSARQTCACVFVSHRTLDSCRAELDPLARRLMTVEVGTQQVTARAIAGLSRATARYEQGFGCTLVD